MAEPEREEPCLVCRAELREPIKGSGTLSVDCPNCGAFRLTDSAAAELALGFDDAQRALISYAIRQRADGVPVSSAFMKKICESTTLPSALERVDNVVLHLASAAEPGVAIDLDAQTLRAVIGAVSSEAAAWAVFEAVRFGYVQGLVAEPYELVSATLTTRGWNRHQDLMRDGVGSRHGFMAMKYNDQVLDDVFVNHLKPAVAHTGYELRRNDEAPAAGLIDNRMRVQIRTSRFVICDLSHGNKGAYWEAGFAEGIGRPVIYTCRKDVFDDEQHEHHPHFDTKHHATIVWDPSDLAPAMQQLKDMIRATLPAEAVMEDKN